MLLKTSDLMLLKHQKWQYCSVLKRQTMGQDKYTPTSFSLLFSKLFNLSV